MRAEDIISDNAAAQSRGLPGMSTPQQAAVLALADGTVFHGAWFGAKQPSVGELVFNTAMSGYQEILTDPSYHQQLVTFTCPHIGNVGINVDDTESARVQVAGCVVNQLSAICSNWRSEQDLSTYLAAQNTIGIAGIDTRRLTRLLRDSGAQGACIMPGVDAQAAITAAQAFAGLSGQDLTAAVSVASNCTWQESVHEISGRHNYAASDASWHVVVVDYGIKRQILRRLIEAGCQITCVPACSTAADILALNPDGVLLSNGPGDPSACCQQQAEIQRLLQHKKLPIFGICLGFQLLALAAGAKTFKMKFGHHGANHPVVDLESGRVMITSQNHGFAVDERSLPSNWQVTHRSLFDNTLQGFTAVEQPVFAVQGHPEASPGPVDMNYLFDRFIGLIAHAKTS